MTTTEQRKRNWTILCPDLNATRKQLIKEVEYALSKEIGYPNNVGEGTPATIDAQALVVRFEEMISKK